MGEPWERGLKICTPRSSASTERCLKENVRRVDLAHSGVMPQLASYLVRACLALGDVQDPPTIKQSPRAVVETIHDSPVVRG